MKQIDVPDLNDELMKCASQRFNITHPLEEKRVCGFRHLGLPYVAELITDKVTDKPDDLLVDFTLNIYGLMPDETEKVAVGPKMPHENRVKRFHLPKRELVLTRSFDTKFKKADIRHA